MKTKICLAGRFSLGISRDARRDNCCGIARHNSWSRDSMRSTKSVLENEDRVYYMLHLPSECTYMLLVAKLVEVDVTCFLLCWCIR